MMMACRVEGPVSEDHVGVVTFEAAATEFPGRVNLLEGWRSEDRTEGNDPNSRVTGTGRRFGIELRRDEIGVEVAGEKEGEALAPAGRLEAVVEDRKPQADCTPGGMVVGWPTFMRGPSPGTTRRSVAATSRPSWGRRGCCPHADVAYGGPLGSQRTHPTGHGPLPRRFRWNSTPVHRRNLRPRGSRGAGPQDSGRGSTGSSRRRSATGSSAGGSRCDCARRG